MILQSVIPPFVLELLRNLLMRDSLTTHFFIELIVGIAVFFLL